MCPKQRVSGEVKPAESEHTREIVDGVGVGDSVALAGVAELVEVTVRVTLKIVGTTVVRGTFWSPERVVRVLVTLAVVRESESEGAGVGVGVGVGAVLELEDCAATAAMQASEKRRRNHMVVVVERKRTPAE